MRTRATARQHVAFVRRMKKILRGENKTKLISPDPSNPSKSGSSSTFWRTSDNFLVAPTTTTSTRIKRKKQRRQVNAGTALRRSGAFQGWHRHDQYHHHHRHHQHQLARTRFFFGSSNDERQLPCCSEESDADGETNGDETAEELSETCRQCSGDDTGAGRCDFYPGTLGSPSNCQSVRFFFATQGVEDMNDLPCCNRKERRRLANATDCGQKPYHNRILGGIISKVGKEYLFPVLFGS